MGGGIKQPRPTEPFDPTARPPAVDSLPEEAVLPRLIVFDLDNTLWTPELYTLRSFSGYADASPPNPVAGKDVWLLDGAAEVPHELAYPDPKPKPKPKPNANPNPDQVLHELA